MLNHMDLYKMSQEDISKAAPDILMNANMVDLDSSLPQTERIERLLEQIHNPYCFLSGDTPVRVRFAETEKTLSQALSDYFFRLKQK